MKLPRPRRSTFGVGALVVAGLAVTQSLDALLPSATGSDFGTGAQRPFVREGVPGSPIALRTGDLTVTSIEGATTLDQSGTYPVTTEAVFVVVHFTWKPRQKKDTVTVAEVSGADERTFRATSIGSGRDGVECPFPPPGITARCTAVVELPRDALPGATVTLSTNAIDEGLDDVARVDLGIDASASGAWGRGRTATVSSGLEGLS